MPLLVEGKPVGSVKTVAELIQRYPHFKESAVLLRSMQPKCVESEGLLYIGQREMAATSPDDNAIKTLGTDDATTCHIVILRHTASGASCLAHFDGSGVDEAINKMIHLVKEVTAGKQWGQLDLYLAGGFKDDRKLSDELSTKILEGFNKVPEEIHLQLACISELNSVARNKVQWPVIYGLAINVKTGEIFPATFADRGPDQPLRSARHFTGAEEVTNIYDHKKHRLVIGPFDYTTMDEIDLLCRLPDPIIREHLSTSPEQEPPHFEGSVRAALVQIRDFPDPLKSVFKDGKPKCYCKDQDGNWKPE